VAGEQVADQGYRLAVHITVVLLQRLEKIIDDNSRDASKDRVLY
jgi:hypothetical protein